MTELMKQRIVGGVVIVAVLAIFLPILLHRSKPMGQVRMAMSIPSRQSSSEQLQLQLPEDKQGQVASVVKAAPKLAVAAKPVQPTVQAAPKLAAVAKPAKPAVTTTPKLAIHSSKPLSVSSPINQKILASAIHTPKAWVVQVGSFSSASNAQHLVAHLRHRGLDAYTKSAHGITRVFVGPKIHRRDAQSLSRLLDKSFHLKGMIRQYHA